MEIVHEYRILVNGVQSLMEWTEDFYKAIITAHELRDANPTATIEMEISPWYREGVEYTCPGCEYRACPVGGI